MQSFAGSNKMGRLKGVVKRKWEIDIPNVVKL